jgi:thiol:disulfide interchange protein
MIPINLAIIGAGTQAGDAAVALLLGATYGAAMALVYGVLGLVVILTAGRSATINASPWFNWRSRSCSSCSVSRCSTS